MREQWYWDIIDRLDKMVTGADQINIEVNTLSGRNKKNIDILLKEISRFKIE
ncbi:hypothetical protein FACS1894172_21590 [Spirochaetia bacterium]|nr:hypothetical protein FACS1894172_21590 [Spirochaetia bacterium]